MNIHAINITLPRFKNKFTLLLTLVGFLLAFLGFMSAIEPTAIHAHYDARSLIHDYDHPFVSTIGGLPSYTSRRKLYLDQGYPQSGYERVYKGADLTGHAITSAHEQYGSMVAMHPSAEEVYVVDAFNSVSFTYDFTFATLNYLAISYFVLDDGVEDTQVSITVNGVPQFAESQAITLPVTWQFVTDTFAVDRYENEIQPNSEKIKMWRHHQIEDARTLHAGPYAYFLAPGDIVSIEYVNAPLLIGFIEIFDPTPLPTYEQYRSRLPQANVVNTLKMISARSMVHRSDSSIRLRTEQDASTLFYDTQFLRLNTIFGDSWERGGQAVTYEVNVEQAGFYHLSFRYRQYLLNDMMSHRRIKINGEVPFDEMEAVAFPFTMQFTNRTLKNARGEAYQFYFEPGTHTITLQAVLYPYRMAIETIQYIMQNIQQLSLSIKRYTAGSNDLFRDWDIERFFPEASGNMLGWAEDLDRLFIRLGTISVRNNPSQLANLSVARSRLRTLANSINRLPGLMVQFSDGDSSVNQMLGFLLQIFFRSSLEIERTMIHGQQRLPRPTANFFRGLYEGGARLVLSFINNPYSATQMRGEDLNVWVNYPRQYIEIMQSMIDAEFPSDRRVTLSQMPDENKLILSNISGRSPDVALGVNHWIPFEFAARDAALDLRQFQGYEQVVSQFAKGAMIPYIFEEGVFGLPETQNFWVTFYRRDVLDSIGMTSIPQTWDDIIGVLPLLQSFGLNYFVPLSQFSGLKPFVATLPFIHQFGGSLYAEDGSATTINAPNTLQGLTLMSELFTLYNIPKFVASFYNNFRYGTIPIGIGDLGTYLLLSSAASELDGLWDVDLHPGQPDGQGGINRSAASGAQSTMILSNTQYPEESWDFLKWWLSAPIQERFGRTLQSTYGRTFFWNSANLEAFANSGMPARVRSMILQQWDYALEASRIPGSYMVEREISNAWTNIVFNGVNPRQAIDEAVRISNREILYKMEEFGYALRGTMIRPYPVPTIHNIDRWLVGHA